MAQYRKRFKSNKKQIKKSLATCYSCRYSPTTFAATVLNFCVRDGNRCVHSAIVTRLFFFSRLISENQILILFLSKLFYILSPRPISITQLNASLHLHLWPINLVTFKGSYFLRMGSLILRLVSHLDAFSVYPFHT